MTVFCHFIDNAPKPLTFEFGGIAYPNNTIVLLEDIREGDNVYLTTLAAVVLNFHSEESSTTLMALWCLYRVLIIASTETEDTALSTSISKQMLLTHHSEGIVVRYLTILVLYNGFLSISVSSH